MREAAAQLVLHTLVAAVVAEALLRVWRIERPGLRLAFRAGALGLPVALLPVFRHLTPWRASEQFRDDWALFSSAEWSELRVGAAADIRGSGPSGVALGDLLVGGAALLGAVLLLRDLFGVLAWTGRKGETVEPPEALREEIARLSLAMRIAPPRLVVRRDEAPGLHCSGWRTPVLTITTGALARLDPGQREAALAHELAHAEFKDPALGWLLTVVRAVLFFNPFSQALGRAAVQEMERRADARAAAVIGRPTSVASALGALHTLAAGGHKAVEARLRRLLAPSPPPATRAGLRLALAGLGVGILLFFVV